MAGKKSKTRKPNVVIEIWDNPPKGITTKLKFHPPLTRKTPGTASGQLACMFIELVTKAAKESEED